MGIDGGHAGAEGVWLDPGAGKRLLREEARQCGGDLQPGFVDFLTHRPALSEGRGPSSTASAALPGGPRLAQSNGPDSNPVAQPTPAKLVLGDATDVAEGAGGALCRRGLRCLRFPSEHASVRPDPTG